VGRRKPGRNRRTQIDGQFAAREIKMLESPGFRVLSLSARRVLDRIEIELAHHGGMDNGRPPVTYDDFARYGMDRHAIGPAKESAALLRLSEVTLARWSIEGMGPPYRKFGRRVVYAKADLIAWADDQTQQSTSQVQSCKPGSVK
jgi:hypothetical protein